MPLNVSSSTDSRFSDPQFSQQYIQCPDLPEWIRDVRLSIVGISYRVPFYQAFLVVCAVYDRRGRVVWGKEIFLVLWGMYDGLPGSVSRGIRGLSDIVLFGRGGGPGGAFVP